MLELKNISKTVNDEPHIYPADLNFQSGALNVLLGPTLAGKTSLLRLMGGLDQATTGDVLLDGKPIRKIPLQKRNLAIVYQQFINYPSLTVYENIASSLRIKKAPDLDDTVRSVAKKLRIDSLLDRYPGELSGGQQQRTAIARALAKKARLLLMDEPLVNLDYKLREELRAELKEILEKDETIAIYSTTDPEEALLLGGNITLMEAGRALQQGPTLEAYHRPAEISAARIYSDPPLNVFKARVKQKDQKLQGELPGKDRFNLASYMQDLEPGKYQFGIRPNHSSLRQNSPEDLKLKGNVELAEINGAETFLYIRSDDYRFVLREEGVHGFALNEEVTFYLNPAKMLAFSKEGLLAASYWTGEN